MRTNWQAKNDAPKEGDFLGESRDGLKRFEAELKTCDPAMGRQLMAARKEQILGDLVDLVGHTDSAKLISNVDRAIAFSQTLSN